MTRSKADLANLMWRERIALKTAHAKDEEILAKQPINDPVQDRRVNIYTSLFPTPDISRNPEASVVQIALTNFALDHMVDRKIRSVPLTPTELRTEAVSVVGRPTRKSDSSLWMLANTYGVSMIYFPGDSDWLENRPGSGYLGLVVRAHSPTAMLAFGSNRMSVDALEHVNALRPWFMRAWKTELLSAYEKAHLKPPKMYTQ